MFCYVGLSGRFLAADSEDSGEMPSEFPVGIGGGLPLIFILMKIKAEESVL